jgi:hypothetical protein
VPPPNCGPFHEATVGDVTFWTAFIPCGTFNLRIFGTSQNGPNTAAIGASIKGDGIGSNGLEGIENPSCSIQ